MAPEQNLAGRRVREGGAEEDGVQLQHRRSHLVAGGGIAGVPTERRLRFRSSLAQVLIRGCPGRLATATCCTPLVEAWLTAAAQSAPYVAFNRAECWLFAKQPCAGQLADGAQKLAMASHQDQRIAR